MLNTVFLLTIITASEPPLPPPPPIPGQAEVLLPQPPRGRVIEVPPPPPIPSATLKPPTMEQFAKQFQPVPGVHEVTIIHPISGKPVEVTFRLPPGKPKRVHVNLRSIEFEYDKKDVVIIFRLFNIADVRYN